MGATGVPRYMDRALATKQGACGCEANQCTSVQPACRDSSEASGSSRGEAGAPITSVLFPLTESPAGATPQLFRPVGNPFAEAAAAGGGGGGGGGGGAETPGMAAAARAPKRSPLGRNVVTALEAQLDQARRQTCLSPHQKPALPRLACATHST